MEIAFVIDSEPSSFLPKDAFLNQTSKQIGAFSCQKKINDAFFITVTQNLFNFWETLNGHTLTHTNQDETKRWRGTKDVPVWFYFGGSQLERVGIFFPLMFSHHGL